MNEYESLRRLDDIILRHYVKEFRGAYDENDPTRSYDTWRDHITMEEATQAGARDMERIEQYE